MEFNNAIKAATLPVIAITIFSVVFDIFSFIVRYLGYYYLAVIGLLMMPIAIIGFGAAGYIATRKFTLDRTASTFAGGIAGLIYGIIAIILKVIFEVLLSVANPNAKDFYATLILGYVPAETAGVISKVVCIGIVMPASVLGGILAGFAGSYVASMKAAKAKK